MKRFRESRLGRFVSQREAAANPGTTVAETIRPVTWAGALIRIQVLEATMIDAAATLSGMPYDSDRCEVVAGELERVALDRIPGELDAHT